MLPRRRPGYEFNCGSSGDSDLLDYSQLSRIGWHFVQSPVSEYYGLAYGARDHNALYRQAWIRRPPHLDAGPWAIVFCPVFKSVFASLRTELAGSIANVLRQ
jgi:hypothetical protein